MRLGTSEYPVCRRAVPAGTPWTEVRRLLEDSELARAVGPELAARASELRLPPFLFDLGRVMLTLTDGNVDQVLPLSRLLAGRADRFGFNRLSAAGRGKDLAPVDPKKFESFLRTYLDEAAGNPVLGRKDNLLNLVHRERGEPVFGGCTGYGCGAAFNFVSLLSDGEVHACRKFPSPIGRVGRSSLSEIYGSREAKRYRDGATGCRGCSIRPVCGGCLAVAHSFGRDVFTDRDPYCFREDR